MSLPPYERVIFNRNPLQQVICQLRFPTILKIDTDEAARTAFQESIRKDYPHLNKRREMGVDVPQEFAQLINILPIGNTSIITEFISEDRQWTISLGSNFIALTSRDYQQWEGFEARFRMAFDSLIAIYTPSFFERVGLRYVNLIQRTKLATDKDTPWSELIKPHIAGMMSMPEVSAQVLEQNATVDMSIEEGHGNARIHHETVRDQNTNEQIYVIDNDFFTNNKTEVDDAFTLLSNFHLLGGRFFQWFITDRLRALLEPRSVTG